jgi:hypothetical protein
MKTRQIRVTSRTDGATAGAELIVCELCNKNKFLIYTIAGHDHAHLQCANCSETYCNGTCDKPPDADPDPRVIPPKELKRYYQNETT